MTIRELSKIIHVSPATISIVLNGKKGVSEETREMVLEAVKKYHYHPVSRTVESAGKVLLIKYWKSGVLVEENQGFVSTIIDSVEGELRKKHMGLTMQVIKTELEQTLESLDYSEFCGVIVIASEIEKERYGLLERLPVPFVAVDNPMPDFACNCVCMNNAENVGIALRYVKRCGHDRIGYFRSASAFENFLARREAFCYYTEKIGLAFHPGDEIRLRSSLTGAHDDLTKRLEETGELPPCFFADNDSIALGAIRALKEHGFKVPGDISVIGFDDIPFSAVSSPPLSTVRVQREAIGRQAVVQLMRQIEDPDAVPLKTQITGELVARESVSVNN